LNATWFRRFFLPVFRLRRRFFAAVPLKRAAGMPQATQASSRRTPRRDDLAISEQ
jgi:hypothetical protein